MVAETRETMNKMFEQMNAMFTGAVEAGQRTQQTWFDAMTGVGMRPAGFEEFAGRTERIAREWAPFASKNVEVFTQSCDNGVRAGQDAFNAAQDMVMQPAGGDYAKCASRFWDAGFDAIRLNVENFSKTSTQALENCSKFARSVFDDAPVAKSAAKTAAK